MRRRLIGLAALVAVLSLGALIAAGPAGSARKAPKEFFGLVPQAELSNADIDRMAKGKVGLVRFALYWPAVEPTNDRFDWAATDNLLGDLAAKGMRPVANVSGVPGYLGSDPALLPVGSGEQRAEWEEFVRAGVARYGAGGEYWTDVYPTQHPGARALPVKTWQIWNEQNGPKHATNPNPENYAQLVKISHAAITAIDPAGELILGGMFGRPTGTAGGGEPITAWSFLKRMYKVSGTKGSFEGVSVHPYSPGVAGIKDQIERMRKVLKKNKDKRTDLWLTELGWGSEKLGRLGVGVKKQAKLVKKSFKLLLKKRRKWRIGGVLYYTWRDVPASKSPCDWCTTAGLFGPNGFDPKPAWKKFVRFTGGS